MSERHFVWGPGSRWAEGPGIKEKGLGKWWKQLFIFCHFLGEGSGIHRSWTVYLRSAGTPLSPNVSVEAQRSHWFLVTPRSQSSTCCSDACSDVALICRTRLSFAAFVRAVGQKRPQYYVSGSLSWDCAWPEICFYWDSFSSILNSCFWDDNNRLNRCNTLYLRF